MVLKRWNPAKHFCPQYFNTESFGPKVVDIIAERINDSCSKKPLDTKLKELKDKYKTPENYKVL